MTITNAGNGVYIGLSTDTKAVTGIPAGSTFIETDTGRNLRWNGSQWVPQVDFSPIHKRHWGIACGFQGGGVTALCYGLLAGKVVALGTGTASSTGTDTTDGNRASYITGTNNSHARAGWQGASTFSARKFNPTFTIRFRLAQVLSSTANMLYIGFASAGQPAADTTIGSTFLNSKYGVLFGWRLGDTTTQIISNNNQASATVTPVTGIWNSGLTDTNPHTLSISLNDSVPKISWSFDGVQQTDITDATNSVPASTALLMPIFFLEAQTATTQQMFEHWSEFAQDWL